MAVDKKEVSDGVTMVLEQHLIFHSPLVSDELTDALIFRGFTTPAHV